MGTFILVGPGRAGLSLGITMRAAGHQAVGVLARNVDAASDAAEQLDAPALEWEVGLPDADLLVVAVRDDAIEDIAGRLAPFSAGIRYAAHLSGLKPVSALTALSDVGLKTGSLHPLQSLPNPVDGSAALPGSWVAVAAPDPGLFSFLEGLVESFDAHPFAVADECRDLYHAAATAGSNYLIATLALAEELFDLAGVPFEAARPLVESVTANAFRLGAAAALTGPIARGDLGTVRSQLSAVARSAPDAEIDYRAFARATARVAGTTEAFEGIL